MLATVMYGPADVRFEQVDDPRILKPTDAIIKLAATCICGSDLWPYRGLQPNEGPAYMGHEYCGVVIEVGSEVRTIRPGQFVVGSFCISDNTCPHCRYGFQSDNERQHRCISCSRRSWITSNCSKCYLPCFDGGLRTSPGALASGAVLAVKGGPAASPRSEWRQTPFTASNEKSKLI